MASRTFDNPIIPGFHPDPSICRVGDDFYLVTSSFEYFPGVPIFHSRDLVHWRQLGHVLTRRSQLDLEGVPSSGGIYAPTLRYHEGRFYMVTTHVNGGGNFYVTSRSPTGPWSNPHWLDEAGIDPSLSFTEDRVYYTRNGPGRDFDHPLIYQAELDLRTKKLKRKPRPIWEGMGGVWPEAPHLYKVGPWFYLTTAEGGTHFGHTQVVVRSRSAFGPFEPYRRNPILSHTDRPRHPIQATGHADLVWLPDGSCWAVFLGVRPKAGRHHHLGRETFLAPVTWTEDGWPEIGDAGRVELEMRAPALARHSFAADPVRDPFDAGKLGPVWTFLRNPSARDWSLHARPGCLRLLGSKVTLDEVASPAFVARRQQHFDVRCRSLLDFEPRHEHEEAGLVVRVSENFYYALALRRSGQRRIVRLVQRLRGKTRTVAQAELGRGPILLEVLATPTDYEFFARTGRRRARLGKLSAKQLSAESVGRFGGNCFTGAFVGMYATGNGRRSETPADFEWFEYDPS